jgi:hypothetical protein
MARPAPYLPHRTPAVTVSVWPPCGVDGALLRMIALAALSVPCSMLDLLSYSGRQQSQCGR